MDWKVPLADLDIDQQETEAVLRVLESKWLTMGGETAAFEEEFAAFNGSKHAIALSSCTAALHLACVAIDLQPGDEVILPALTFVATANAVRYTGATPVFADIASLDNLTLSIESIRSQITENTKAIIPMHYAGYPSAMAAIQQIAAEHNLFVIEDAAHAVGSQLIDKKMGCWGDMGCFSFFSNKNLITGEGGMLVTDNDEFAERIKRLRSHGMTTLTWDRHKGHAWSYDVVDLGYNYRIDEIRAAMGRVQLEKLGGNNKKRKEITDLYQQKLSEKVPDLHVPFMDHAGVSSYHIMPILLPEGIERKIFMDTMKEAGIQTSIHYPPIYSFTNYGEEVIDWAVELPMTQAVALREVTLPLFPDLSEDQVDYVVSQIRSALDVQQKVS